MTTTILVVDDQSSVRHLLQEYLAEQGFRVLTATDGQHALAVARHDPPDLILLDIMMPKMDGYQFLRTYRQERQTPIIIITAREEETDAVLGLDLGADDYIIKPFRMRELAARIRAVLKRATGGAASEVELTCGELRLDLARRRVWVGPREVRLTPTEYRLLHELAVHINRVLTHEQLLTAVWGSEYQDDLDYLRAYIYNLRKKIESDPETPQYILRCPGVGYMLACPENGEPEGC